MPERLRDLEILYLIKTMGVGGSERFTLNLCKHFAPLVSHITVFSSGGTFVNELDKFGIDHIESPLAASTDSGSFIKLREVIKDIISKKNISLIHSQHRIFVTVLNTLNLHGAKVLYTANNYFDDLFQKFIFPDAAVAISPIIEQNLHNTLLIKKSHIYRINYGVKVPLSEDSIENKNMMGGINTLSIGFVGRIIKEKGIIKLLKAVKKLYSSNYDFTLKIKGTGKDYKEVSDFIKDNLPMDKVQLTDRVNDLDELYKDIDILVLPTDMNEGLPLTLMEAAARKIIILSSAKGAIPDLIKNNETGFLLMQNTPDEIEDRLIYIINNYNDFNYIRQKGLEKVNKDFSLTCMLSNYEKLYLELLG